MTEASQTPAPTAPSTAFDPAAFATFRFVAVEVDEQALTVTLRYALDDAIAFAETIRFEGVAWPSDPARQEAFRRLARLLHLLAGVSYYKTAVPPAMVVETGPLSPRLRTLLQDVYTLGLGEFAYRNQIDVRERVAFPAADDGDGGPQADGARDTAPSGARGGAAPDPVVLPSTGRTLVPIGGGKDSVVALEIVQRAGREAICFSVGRATPIVRCVEVTGLPHAVATRSLSPNIGELNASGALNGHVPVTAVVSTIALMTAVLHGADAVAMANERSASEGNLVWNGLDVNHQWSKGADFERELRGLLEAEVVVGLDYRSVLRSASELTIARAFSRLEQFHPHFTSCNAVFRIDPARRRSNWCGNCPKCRFVYLALAPWLDPPALRAVFGVDMLDDMTQYDGFLDLAGLREHKPFECVGEEAESLVAMRLIAGADADGAVLPGQEAIAGARRGPSPWAGHAVVRRLRDEHLVGLGGEAGGPALELPFVLEPTALAALPTELRPAAEAVLGNHAGT